MNPSPLPLFIVGPCVLEGNGEDALEVADTLAELALELGVTIVFKASFDKANRTRADSFRGPGLDRGLELLSRVHQRSGLPILTDIHEPHQAAPVAEVADILQIPALLCRQTDLIEAAARTNKTLNIKKGQFLAPQDILWPVDKARRAGASEVWICERGTSFGYHNLVVDPEGLALMLELAEDGDFEIVFDATHAVQRPAASEGVTTGNRRFVPPLMRAAAAIGVRRFFVETYPDPERAPSDAANALPLRWIPELLRVTRDLCLAIDHVMDGAHGPGGV